MPAWVQETARYLTLLLVGLLAGRMTAPPAMSAGYGPTPPPGVRERVRRILRDQYARTMPPDDVLENGCVRGMVAALGDPHTVYMDRFEAQRWRERFEGKKSDIGAAIEMRGERPTFATVPKDSPAYIAGIREGDEIVAVDGVEMRARPLDEVIARIHGTDRTPVIVAIGGASSAKARRVIIEREWYERDTPVRHRLAKGTSGRYVIVTLASFNDRARRDFLALVNGADLRSADGIVLDVRDNGGGKIDVGRAIACSWLPDGAAFARFVEDGRENRATCDGDGALRGKPTVVVVNGESASAAEMLAGALRDNRAATLVGTRTFGKGSAQQVITLTDGSVLRVTTMFWKTPSGAEVDKVGLAPDRLADEPIDRALSLLTAAR